MTRTIHFASISGGADSLATALLAKERAEKRGMDLRFINADLGANEHQITHDYIGYLEQHLGPIQRVRADFADALAERRRICEREWSREKRVRKHTADCKARQAALLRAEWGALCDCPVRASPPVPPELIEQAKAALTPTGEPFLDLCLLKARFPSRKAQFCTEELKLEPINRVIHPLLEAGHNVVSWIGERADESAARAAKPPIQRIRWPKPGGNLVLYRPIHKWAKADCFAIAKRHGVKPNSLYQMGMKRVGCMLCINCSKEEVGQVDRRFPEMIERIAKWERLVAKVSRRGAASFFAGTVDDPEAGQVKQVVEWSRTTRGGKQFDLLQAIARNEQEEQGAMCESAYGLCE